MLKIGYNNSKNHSGSKTHCEKPERIHYCVDNLKNTIPPETFVTSTIPKNSAIKMLLTTHSKEHIQSLLMHIPQEYFCKKCNHRQYSEKMTFDEFIEANPQCAKCKTMMNITDLYCYLDADTYFTAKTFDIVLEGVGILKELIDNLNTTNTTNTTNTRYGFALIRPPGHHCNNKGSGFCIVNNAVIASKYALSVGFKKVFILDIDFHHGDGTQNLIRDCDDIYFCSLHGYGEGIYPGTGSEIDNTDHILNIPIRIGMGATSRYYVTDDYYMNLIETSVSDFINQSDPDIIIVSCGFNAHCEDTLEGLNLTDNAYVRIVNHLKLYNTPLLFITEGGYNVIAISRTIKKMTEVMN